MIVRYIVETNFCKSFTAKREVKDLDSALKIIKKLLKQNEKIGNKKYSRFIIYDVDTNNIICSIE